MKKNIITVKDDFVSYLNKQKKLTAIVIGIIVLLIICLFIFVPKVQARIRSSEINTLVSQETLAKKANFLDIKTAKEEINEKTAITVLFSVPSGDTYNKIINILKDTDKMAEFNHSIFIYPIVYDAEKIEKEYSINKNEPTIIFFENGKEKNRLSIDESFEVSTMLIPSLNQLPLSATDPSVPSASTTTSSTTETTASAQAVEEQTGEEEQTPVDSTIQ